MGYTSVYSLLDERTNKMLEVLGIRDPGTASKEAIMLALGRLLAVKASPAVSVHEVTKEVRRALELVLKSPLKENVEEAVIRAVYMNPPFDSDVLNRAYRVLLEKLLKETVKQAEGLTPMWRRRLINLSIENLYNIAVARETLGYRNRIFEVLGEFKKEQTGGEGK